MAVAITPCRKVKNGLEGNTGMNGYTLNADIARCDGVGYEDGGEMDWREGCKTCLRRTAPRPSMPVMIAPPPILDSYCEYVIEPPKRKNRARG